MRGTACNGVGDDAVRMVRSLRISGRLTGNRNGGHRSSHGLVCRAVCRQMVNLCFDYV